MKYSLFPTNEHPIELQCLIGVFVLTCAGFLLRIHDLGYDPLWVDEAISVLAAHGWLQHGSAVLPSGIPYPRAPLSTYIIAKGIQLFGDNEWAVRSPSVILGTLTIPLTYVLGKKVAGKEIGLIAAFLVTFSFFSIGWSRQARMYQVFQFFFLFVITSYAYFKSNKRFIYLFLIFGGTILVHFSHRMWKILLPILLIDALMVTSIKNKKINTLRYIIASLILIYVGVVIVFKNPVLPSWIYGLFTKGINEIVYWEHPFEFFVINYSYLWWVAVFGSVFVLLRNRKSGMVVIVSFWFSMFAFSYFGKVLGLGFWWPRYLYFTLPFFFLLSASGLWTLSFKLVQIAKNLSGRTITEHQAPEKRKILHSLAPVLTAVGISTFILFTGIFPDIGIKASGLSEIDEPQPNYRDAAQVIKGNMKENDIIITNRPPMVFYYLGKVDYRANHSFVKQKGEDKYDVYTGAGIIEDRQQLEKLVGENPRGWVIFNPYMNLVGRNWVERNLYLWQEIPSTLDDQRVYIYSWGITK